MSDGLTSTTPTAEPDTTAQDHGSVAAVVRQAVLVVAVFAVVGALCGVLWYVLWTPPKGTVVDHGWYPDETGLRHLFSGTGWYVVIAVVAGLCVGLVTSWLFDRAELVTLVAVIVGSVVAALLMRQVGHVLGPGDPHALAKTTTAKSLDGNLVVSGNVPLVAFPFGSLLGLCAVYLVTSHRGPTRSS